VWDIKGGGVFQNTIYDILDITLERQKKNRGCYGLQEER
jgi:hypothetical protein